MRLSQFGPFSYANPGQALQTLNGVGDVTAVASASEPAYSLLASFLPSVATAVPVSLRQPLATISGVVVTPFELFAYYLLYRLIR